MRTICNKNRGREINRNIDRWTLLIMPPYPINSYFSFLQYFYFISFSFSDLLHCYRVQKQAWRFERRISGFFNVLPNFHQFTKYEFLSNSCSCSCYFFLNILLIFSDFFYEYKSRQLIWIFLFSAQSLLLFFSKIFADFPEPFFESKWNYFFRNKRKCTECTGGDSCFNFVKRNGWRTGQFDFWQVSLIWLIFSIFYG